MINSISNSLTCINFEASNDVDVAEIHRPFAELFVRCPTETRYIAVDGETRRRFGTVLWRLMCTRKQGNVTLCPIHWINTK